MGRFDWSMWVEVGVEKAGKHIQKDRVTPKACGPRQVLNTSVLLGYSSSKREKTSQPTHVGIKIILDSGFADCKDLVSNQPVLCHRQVNTVIKAVSASGALGACQDRFWDPSHDAFNVRAPSLGELIHLAPAFARY